MKLSPSTKRLTLKALLLTSLLGVALALSNCSSTPSAPHEVSSPAPAKRESLEQRQRADEAMQEATQDAQAPAAPAAKSGSDDMERLD